MTHKLIDLLEDHAAWAAETLPKATAIGAAIHALRELGEVLDEVTAEPVNKNKLATEIADTLFCLFDAARRSGIRIDDIVEAGRVKLEINKQRKWAYNGDGSYSHVKPRRITVSALLDIFNKLTDVEEINYNSDLEKDLGLDSLDKLDLIAKCEKEFGVSLDDVNLVDLTTPEQLFDIINKKLN